MCIRDSLYGAAFEEAYIEAEKEGTYERQVPARQLYALSLIHISDLRSLAVLR